MDIMALGAIGELVGGVAVIGSLIYVGLQVRHNTSALRANSAQAFAASINSVALKAADDLDHARVWRLAMETPEALTEDERTYADLICVGGFNVLDSAVVQAEFGTIDPTTTSMVYQRIRACFDIPYYREWWSRNPWVYSEAMNAFAEKECGMRRWP